MMNIKRLIDFQSNPTLIILMFLLLFGAMSCSGSGNNALSPPIEDNEPFSLQNIEFAPGHNIFGVCTVYFDPATLTAEITCNRNIQNHLNLTGFIVHGNCPDGGCLTWSAIGPDADDIYHVDLYLANPTPYTAFDMRIIFMELPYNDDAEESWKIANPDSYCTFYDEPLSPHPDDWDDVEEKLNPFIAFEKDDPLREFLPDPDGDGPVTYGDIEPLELYVPPGSFSGEIDIIIDGSWPDHCKEPYEITGLPELDQPFGKGILSFSQPLSTVYIECVVADWQQDIKDPYGVSLYMPDIIDSGDPDFPNMIPMLPWPIIGPNAWPPGDDIPPNDPEQIQFMMKYGNYERSTLRRYYCNITNDVPAISGIYPAMIVAESPDTDWSGDPEDEKFEKIYNVFKIEVQYAVTNIDKDKLLQIAYSSYRNEYSSDIFTYFFLTGDHVQLTNDGGEYSEEFEVSINFDASMIAFASNWNKDLGMIADFEIYTCPIHYTGAPLVPFPANSNNKDEWEQQTFNDGYDDRMPDWSPDGTKIAYCGDGFGPLSMYEILTVDYNNPASEFRVTVYDGDDESPHYDKFDPTGHFLYFHSDASGGGNTEIYHIDPTSQEGPGNWAEPCTFDPLFDGFPTTDPVTGYLAWASERYDNFEILYTTDLVDFEPDYITRLTENDDLDTEPSYSLNGEWIAFTSDRNADNRDIWIMDSNGKNPTRITDHELDDFDPYFGGGL